MAKNTAFNSRMFICKFASVSNHIPLTVRSPKCAPQPLTDASVNNRRLCSSAWRGQPVNTFLGFFHQIRCIFKITEHGIFLSNEWGYLQWVFRYHWKGLMCNLPTGTVFSSDARMPINDIRILGVVVKLLFRPSMAVVKMCHFFSVGETSPLLKSTLYSKKSNF